MQDIVQKLQQETLPHPFITAQSSEVVHVNLQRLLPLILAGELQAHAPLGHERLHEDGAEAAGEVAEAGKSTTRGEIVVA